MELHFQKAFEVLAPNLLNGVGVVLYIALIGFALSLVIGLLIALGRISKNKILYGVLTVILEFVRGTPLLVQFFYIYYVIPILINGVVYLFGYKTEFQLDPSICGILGFAINYGCYMSEVIRASIVAVDPGQREAGLALGFSEKQVLMQFIVPPAMRNSVPVFGNYLVMMIKDTSLLAMISVQELLLRTNTFTSQTFMTVEGYTILALFYLVMSLPLSYISRIIEKKLGQGK